MNRLFIAAHYVAMRDTIVEALTESLTTTHHDHNERKADWNNINFLR